MTSVLSNIQSNASVESKLRRAWRKERRFTHLRGLCFVVLWTVALLAVDFLVDWMFALPGWGRVGLLGINAAILLYILWTHWLVDLRRYDALRVALQVERRHPELRSLLVSFIQLQEHQPANSQASPALIRAMKEQAVSETAPLDFREIISYVELKRIAIASVCLIAFAAGISLRWDDYFRILMLRLFNPSAQAAYPTRTHIDPLADLVVRQGDPINLEIHVRGMAPVEGSLYVRPEGGDEEKLPLAVEPASATHPAGAAYKTYRYAFESAFKSFSYRAQIGDARSEVRHVRVIPPPQVVASQVTIHHKPYMKKPDRTTDLLNIEAPEGANIGWKIKVDRPVEGAVMLVGDKDDALKSVPMELSKDGMTMSWSMPADESTAYRFEWKEKGNGFTFREDSRHYIQVTPDTPPDVEILKPVSDDKATVQKTLTIIFRATDDYGVTKARVVYSFNDGPEKTREIAGYNGGVGQDKWELRPDLPEFHDGDLLVMNYCIEVEDNYEGKGGPHKARSASRTLAIVSIPEYQQYIYEKYGQIIEDIESAKKSEQKSSDEVKTIKAQPPK